MPAVNPNKVDSSIDNCAAGFATLETTAGPRPDAPNTARTPDAEAPTASRRMSGERNVGGAGFEEAAEAVEVAGVVGVVGVWAERAVTTAAVEARLTNQPPQTSSRSLAALAAEREGDSGRTTRLGTKNTGSHLQRRTEASKSRGGEVGGDGDRDGGRGVDRGVGRGVGVGVGGDTGVGGCRGGGGSGDGESVTDRDGNENRGRLRDVVGVGYRDRNGDRDVDDGVKGGGDKGVGREKG